MIKILKFEAEWCGPCRAIDIELEKCTQDFDLVRVDVDANPVSVARYHIRSIPTLIFVVDDQEISRLHGKQSAAKIDQTLKEMS